MAANSVVMLVMRLFQRAFRIGYLLVIHTEKHVEIESQQFLVSGSSYTKEES